VGVLIFWRYHKMSQTLTIPGVLDFIIVQGRDINMARSAVTNARREYYVASLRCTVKEHLVMLWGPRILNAVGKNRHSVTNKWSFMRRVDGDYIGLLRKTLEPQFKVELLEASPFLRDYIRVSWK
jgi:hypothetical protein